MEVFAVGEDQQIRGNWFWDAWKGWYKLESCSDSVAWTNSAAPEPGIHFEFVSDKGVYRSPRLVDPEGRALTTGCLEVPIASATQPALLREPRKVVFLAAGGAAKGCQSFIRVVRSTGATVRRPCGPPHLVPTILPVIETAVKEIPSKSHSRLNALSELKSPVRGYATALLCNARPVASGLALIRSRVTANPA
jgi:hypothetical protein